MWWAVGRWQIVQARPFQQTALTSEPALHGCSPLHSPPLPTTLEAQPDATIRPALCYYQAAARAEAQAPQRLHRKAPLSALACLQLGNLRPALELTMDLRCKEGCCLALDKYCHASFGHLGLHHVGSPTGKARPRSCPGPSLLPVPWWGHSAVVF